MEQLLHKMARQLDALDEASLLALWEKYATIVSQFEPTKRWEEAALVFSFIQAKRWKNQLFNHNWAARVKPDDMPSLSFQSGSEQLERTEQAGQAEAKAPRAKVLVFRPRRTPSEDPDPEGERNPGRP